MARKLRVQYPGAIYHVMNRGDRREPIFKDDGEDELLAQVSAKAGAWHYGDELRESAQAKAERIVAEELKRRKWDGSTLAERRKGDPAKLAIARRLRQETTMTLAWIAQRLKVGTKTHLAHLLYWQSRNR